MKTYEEFESQNYIYRRIGHEGEVHHVRKNKRRGMKGMGWRDTTRGIYDMMRAKHPDAVRPVCPEPCNTSDHVLETFEGNNGRSYRKVSMPIRGSWGVVCQSRPRGQGCYSWRLIPHDRYAEMKIAAVGTKAPIVVVGVDPGSAGVAYGGPMINQATEAGGLIRDNVAALESQLAAANQQAQNDRDNYNTISAELTLAHAERKRLEQIGDMSDHAIEELRSALNKQPHRIKNAEHERDQAQERLGDISRKYSDLKKHDLKASSRMGELSQANKSLKQLLLASELRAKHAEAQSRKHQGNLAKANARWEAFVDKVVNPSVSEEVRKLREQDIISRSTIEHLGQENKELRHANKKIRARKQSTMWQDRAEALRRILKTERGGRLINWASVDTYVKKMEK